jgi:hypothetical protein
MVSKPLPGGENTLKATQTDPAGNTSDPTTVKPIVDTEAPGAPRIDSADQNEVVGGEDSAEPGATITVTWPDGSRSTTTVKPDGSWSVATPKDMKPGKVMVTATDKAGNVSDKSFASWTKPGTPVVKTGGTVVATPSVTTSVVAFVIGGMLLALSRVNEPQEASI